MITSSVANAIPAGTTVSSVLGNTITLGTALAAALPVGTVITYRTSFGGVVNGFRSGNYGGNGNAANGETSQGVTDLMPNSGGPNFLGNTTGNQTFVYSGQFFVPPTNNGPNVTVNGVVSPTTLVQFAEQVDDDIVVKVDGVTVINGTQFNDVNTTGALDLTTGWHNIEVRFNNSGGGAGASGANNGWTTNFGFGVQGIGGTGQTIKPVPTTTSGQTAVTNAQWTTAGTFNAGALGDVTGTDYLNLLDSGAGEVMRHIVGGTVTVAGTGTLLLANPANNFHGATTVSSGILTVTSASELGLNSGLVANGTGTLDAQTNITNYNVTLAGGTLSSSVGSPTISGTIQLAPAITAITTVTSPVGQNVITVPIANVAAAHVGSTIVGVNVPPGAIITAVSVTNVTINVPLTAVIPIGDVLSIGNGAIGGAGPMTVTAPITGVPGINGAATIAPNGLTYSGPTTVFAPSNGIAPQYAGTTVITGGATLTLTSNNQLSTVAGLVLGNASAAGALTAFGTLNMQGFSQTLPALVVNSDSSLATNIINIGGGTLQVNGNAVFGGANFSTTDADNVTFTGGGSFAMASPSASGLFQVGTEFTTGNVDAVNVNMTALSAVNINAGPTGIVRVGDLLGTNGGATGADTWSLAASSPAATNTIVANELSLGGESGQNANMTLNLGSGTNVIQANTLNLGAFSASSLVLRGNGIITWAPAVTSGTLTLTNTTGGPAVMNMVNTPSTSNNHETALFDMGTHSANIQISTLTMSAKSADANNATSTFNYGGGTTPLTIGTLVMTNRSGTNTGTNSSTMNLNAGTVTIGAITLAQNSVATGNANVQSATFTVGAANVTILGGGVNMGSATGTATNHISSSVNINAGGTLIPNGSIAFSTSLAGTTDVGSFNLNGGSIDFASATIGSAALPVIGTFTGGTLKNLGELNGGVGAPGTLTKSGTGTLLLPTANGYTGLTSISAGIVDMGNVNSLGGTANGTIVSGTGTLQIDTTTTFPAGETLSLNGNGANGIGALNAVNGNYNVGTLALTGTVSIGSGTPGDTLTIAGFTSTLLTNLNFVGAGNTSVTNGFGNSAAVPGELGTQFYQGANAAAVTAGTGINPDGKPDDLLVIQTQQAPFVGSGSASNTPLLSPGVSYPNLGGGAANSANDPFFGLTGNTPDTTTNNQAGVWIGEITVTDPGFYTFYTASDDGSLLWLDLNGNGAFSTNGVADTAKVTELTGTTTTTLVTAANGTLSGGVISGGTQTTATISEQIVSNNAAQGVTTHFSVPISLSPGVYAIRIADNNGNGGLATMVDWQETPIAGVSTNTTGFAPVVIPASSFTYAPALSVAMNGTGIVRLNGNETYTGATTVNSGTLEVDGTIASTSPTTVTNGTLAGTGTLTSQINVGAGGIISPGANGGSLPGILTSIGSVSFAPVFPAPALNIQVNGSVLTSNTNTEYDQLNVTGSTGGVPNTVTLNNAILNLSVGSHVDNDSVNNSTVYSFINLPGTANVTGNFAGDSFPSTIATPGEGFILTENATATDSLDGNPNDVGLLKIASNVFYVSSTWATVAPGTPVTDPILTDGQPATFGGAFANAFATIQDAITAWVSNTNGERRSSSTPATTRAAPP